MLHGGNRLTGGHQSRRASHPIHLIVLAALLLAQFYLRIHATLEMPISVDEYRHIERAVTVSTLQENPLNFGQGKLLLYFWLALFRPEMGVAGLFVSRAAIALFSLLTGAALAAAARSLFGWKTMLPSLVFYVLAPHALFFERLVLADPVAAGLATLVAWQTILLVKQPNWRRGACVGLLSSMAVLAKLTALFIFLLPVLVIPLFDDRCSFRAFRSRTDHPAHEFNIRYRSSLLSILTVSAGILGVILIGIIVGLSSGQAPELLADNMRLQGSTEENFGQEVARYFTQKTMIWNLFERLYSLPVTLYLGLAACVLIRQNRRPTLYVLLWLALMWVPNLVLSSIPRARYLLLGVPAVAILFGAGSVVIGRLIAEKILLASKGAKRLRWQSHMPAFIAVTLTVMWLIALALPFAHHAIAHPAEVKLPTLDKRNYVLGPSNAWGSREALSYLEAHGQRTDKGVVPVYAVLWRCYLAEVYLVDGLAWSCQSMFPYGEYHYTPEMFDWDAMTRSTPETPHIYVIAEGDPEWQTLSPLLHWQKVICLSHPQKNGPICVWRVSRLDHTRHARPEALVDS